MHKMSPHIAFLDAYSSHQEQLDLMTWLTIFSIMPITITSSLRKLIMKPSGLALLGLLLILSSTLLQLLPNMLATHISYSSASIFDLTSLL